MTAPNVPLHGHSADTVCNEWFDAWPNGEYGIVRCQRKPGHQTRHWHPIRTEPNPDLNDGSQEVPNADG